MPAWAVPLAMGIGSAIGGYFGSNRTNSNRNPYGWGNYWDEYYSAVEYQRQKEFAQHGLRWKVNDAIAAGLHPLAALGANLINYQPQHVGGMGDRNYSGNRTNMAMANMGQSLLGAMKRSMTKEEKAMYLLKLAQEKEKLENMKLQNVGLYKEIHETKQPDMPTVTKDNVVVEGQGDAYQLTKPQVNIQGQQGIEAGLGGAEQDNIMPSGYILRAPNQRTSESIESSWTTQMQYMGLKGWQQAKQMIYWRYPRAKGAEKARMELMKIRPIIREKGYEARYNPHNGMWKKVKIGKEGSRLYLYQMSKYGRKY